MKFGMLISALLIGLLTVLAGVALYRADGGCPDDLARLLRAAIDAKFPADFRIVSMSKTPWLLNMLAEKQCSYHVEINPHEHAALLDRISRSGRWKQQPACTSASGLQNCDKTWERITLNKREGLSCVAKTKQDSRIVSLYCKADI